MSKQESLRKDVVNNPDQYYEALHKVYTLFDELTDNLSELEEEYPALGLIIQYNLHLRIMDENVVGSVSATASQLLNWYKEDINEQ